MNEQSRFHATLYPTVSQAVLTIIHCWFSGLLLFGFHSTEKGPKLLHVVSYERGAGEGSPTTHVKCQVMFGNYPFTSLKMIIHSSQKETIS